MSGSISTGSISAAIAIVTDTDASLPAEVAARCGVRQVPINIHFEQQTLRSDVDIDDTALFARIDREGTMPTTSAPTPGQFVEVFEAAFDAGAESVVCFCVSGEISATYSAAVAARDILSTRDIEIVDSRSLSLGQGFMALAAAEAAQAGASKEEVITHALALRERTYVYAALSTLKYLAISGRIGYLAAGMGNLLSIKPVLTLRDGKLDLLERVRTKKKAWRRVNQLVIDSLAGRPVERIAIVHSNAPEDAHNFKEQLCATLPSPDAVGLCQSAMVAEFSAGLSVHAGAGLVGVGIVAGSEHGTR